MDSANPFEPPVEPSADEAATADTLNVVQIVSEVFRTVLKGPLRALVACGAFMVALSLPSITHVALLGIPDVSVGARVQLGNNLSTVISLTSVVTTTWIHLGALTLLVGIRRGTQPPLIELFTQFRSLPRCVGAQVLFVVCYALGACLAGFGALFAVCVLILMVPIAHFEGLGPLQSVARSSAYMDGQKVSLAVLLLGLGALVAAVVLAPVLLGSLEPAVIRATSLFTIPLSAGIYTFMVVVQAVLYDVRSAAFEDGLSDDDAVMTAGPTPA